MWHEDTPPVDPWRAVTCDVPLGAKAAATHNVQFLKCFLLLHVTTKRSNAPTSYLPLPPEECTLILKKKGLQDGWTGMSLHALTHAVRASVARLLVLPFKPWSVTVEELETNKKDTWCRTTARWNTFLPIACTRIWTHLFKAIVVCFTNKAGEYAFC